MREENGIKIFDAEDGRPDFPSHYPDIADHMISRYGWKLTKVDDKWCWTAGAESHYRKAMAQLKAIDEREVNTERVFCHQAGQWHCSGDCPGEWQYCKLHWWQETDYTWCTCSV